MPIKILNHHFILVALR